MDSDLLNLKMSREQFLTYDDQQQKGIMFSFLTSIDNKLDAKFSALDKDGCAFARKYVRTSRNMKWKMIGIGFTLSIPILYLIAKIFILGCP